MQIYDTLPSLRWSANKNAVQYHILLSSSVLRGDDHRQQLSSSSTFLEGIVRDGKDSGGDDHVGTTATRNAVAVWDTRGLNSRHCWSGGGWSRAVDDEGGGWKGSRRQVRHRPKQFN